MLIKLFAFSTLIYFLYRAVKNLINPAAGRDRRSSRVPPSTAKAAPPPYDPNRVEEIDFEEVRHRNKKSQ